VVASGQIQTLLREDEYGPLLRDDAIMGLAFAQILLGETVDAEVKKRALLAIQRQSLPLVIEHRGWDDPDARLQRLQNMRDVLHDCIEVNQLTLLLPEES
jgi:uncharacterized protein YfeS